jgi:hypothetical protein
MQATGASRERPNQGNLGQKLRHRRLLLFRDRSWKALRKTVSHSHRRCHEHFPTACIGRKFVALTD